MPDTPEMLVPFDGSRGAERLLRHACRVARADDARLSVLCVVAIPAGREPDELSLNLDDTALAAMAKAQEICREEGVAAIFELSHARNLADAILEEARRGGASLICLNLPAHGRHETVLMSPTVQSVLAAAPCSVLLNDPQTELPPVGAANEPRP